MMEDDCEECKHLNFTIRGHDRMGYVYCLDCFKQVPISKAINNLCEEARRVTAEMKGQIH